MNTTRTITICFVFPLSFALSEDCDSAAVVCGAAVSAAAGIVQRLPSRNSVPSRAQRRLFQRCRMGLAQCGRHRRRRHCCAVMFQICVILDDLDVVVNIHTSTSRNQLTDNNIFLQTIQIVTLATDCGIGQSLCGLLEGCADRKLSELEDALVIPWSIGSTVTRETSVSPLSMRSWSASLTSMILRRSTIVPGSR